MTMTWVTTLKKVGTYAALLGILGCRPVALQQPSLSNAVREPDLETRVKVLPSIQPRLFDIPATTLAETYKNILPETWQTCAQIASELCTNNVLREKAYCTPNFAMYTFEDEELYLYFGGKDANPFLAHLDETCNEFRRYGYYKVTQQEHDAVIASVKSGSTVKLRISDLGIQKQLFFYGEEYSWSFYIPIQTGKPNELTPAQHTLVKAMYGEEFNNYMKLLADHGMSESRIYVPNPTEVNSLVRKDDAIAEACFFSGFSQLSFSDLTGSLLTGYQSWKYYLRSALAKDKDISDLLKDFNTSPSSSGPSSPLPDPTIVQRRKQIEGDYHLTLDPAFTVQELQAIEDALSTISGKVDYCLQQLERLVIIKSRPEFMRFLLHDSQGESELGNLFISRKYITTRRALERLLEKDYHADKGYLAFVSTTCKLEQAVPTIVQLSNRGIYNGFTTDHTPQHFFADPREPIHEPLFITLIPLVSVSNPMPEHTYAANFRYYTQVVAHEFTHYLTLNAKISEDQSKEPFHTFSTLDAQIDRLSDPSTGYVSRYAEGADWFSDKHGKLSQILSDFVDYTTDASERQFLHRVKTESSSLEIRDGISHEERQHSCLMIAFVQTTPLVEYMRIMKSRKESRLQFRIEDIAETGLYFFFGNDFYEQQTNKNPVYIDQKVNALRTFFTQTYGPLGNLQ
ncbi:hypothetical protein HZB02_01090 [Candidatus Woesearchaeota archaeon]|nr:hypothetical protein [Candidatus Woesearchaeota archaeon]